MRCFLSSAINSPPLLAALINFKSSTSAASWFLCWVSSAAIISASVKPLRTCQYSATNCCCRLEKRVSTSRSEEHTSELQSRPHLVCRLLLEKKKKKNKNNSCD